MFKKALLVGAMLFGGTAYSQGAVEGGLIKSDNQVGIGNYVNAYKFFGKTELSAYFQVDAEDNRYYKVGGAYPLLEEVKLTGGVGRAEYSPKAANQLQVGIRVEFK